MNSVSNLLSNKFSALTYDEKIDIKNRGRPTPVLTIEQRAKSKGYTSKYNN